MRDRDSVKEMDDQLDIFNFIDKPKSLLEKIVGKILNPVTPCANCLCQYCANNAEELWSKVKPEEQSFPCLICDECVFYSGDLSFKQKNREECNNFILSDYGASRNRKKLKVLGGRDVY